MKRGEHIVDVYYVPTFGVGSYGGLDDRVKRRKRKSQLGFAPPKPKRTSKRKPK